MGTLDLYYQAKRVGLVLLLFGSLVVTFWATEVALTYFPLCWLVAVVTGFLSFAFAYDLYSELQYGGIGGKSVASYVLLVMGLMMLNFVSGVLTAVILLGIVAIRYRIWQEKKGRALIYGLFLTITSSALLAVTIAALMQLPGAELKQWEWWKFLTLTIALAMPGSMFAAGCIWIGDVIWDTMSEHMRDKIVFYIALTVFTILMACIMAIGACLNYFVITDCIKHPEWLDMEALVLLLIGSALIFAPPLIVARVLYEKKQLEKKEKTK